MSIHSDLINNNSGNKYIFNIIFEQLFSDSIVKKTLIVERNIIFPSMRKDTEGKSVSV